MQISFSSVHSGSSLSLASLYFLCVGGGEGGGQCVCDGGAVWAGGGRW